ncbi:hypothetical protein [Vibrio sp. Vb0587]|uniref:hypothetical protein n=1 Tax=Vibrio sp. Vb0587 TaxID=3074626 RepID=UPI0029641A69|nr:hypothetical protein [Vibrio sp. Vb0587]MDW1967835.1 hypothetical protein [Vibrio sp. Vb0587]
MAKISTKNLLGVLKDSVCIEHGNSSFLTMRAMKAIALASSNTKHYHKAFKIDKVEASRELLQKGLGELTINDVKQQRMIAYVDNFDGFTHDMMSELENSSVWVNNERTNDYTQKAAHTNTTYGI